MKYLFEMLDHLNSGSDIHHSFRNYLMKHRPNYCQEIIDQAGPDGLTMLCVGAQMMVEVVQLYGVPDDLDEISLRAEEEKR